MKLATLQAALGSAIVLLSVSTNASHGHRHLHHIEHRHTHLHVHSEKSLPASQSAAIEKRATCVFPSDDPHLVPVTPHEANAGWAMSPDQECRAGSYCPIACKPGMVMAQWNPLSSWSPGNSMGGGLFCDHNGRVQKPFPGKPNCVPGTGALQAVNKCSKPVSWCQTILPGNEAMLIPTVVDSISPLAVPGPSYWQKTSAHFYVQPPGVGVGGCIWGSPDKPIGNWAAFVAGANTDASGLTYVKIGFNPEWQKSDLSSTPPDYGLRVECPDGGCDGHLDCDIKPGSTSGDFCVVTVQSGSTAQIVAYEGSGGSGGSDSSADSTSAKTEVKPKTSAPPAPTTTKSKPTPTTTSTPSSTSTSTTPTSTPSSTSSTSAKPTSTSTSVPITTTTPTSTSKKHHASIKPGIFHEMRNTTSAAAHTSTENVAQPTSDYHAPSKTADKDNEAGRQQGSAALVGLVVAFIATAYFF